MSNDFPLNPNPFVSCTKVFLTWTRYPSSLIFLHSAVNFLSFTNHVGPFKKPLPCKCCSHLQGAGTDISVPFLPPPREELTAFSSLLSHLLCSTSLFTGSSSSPSLWACWGQSCGFHSCVPSPSHRRCFTAGAPKIFVEIMSDEREMQMNEWERWKEAGKFKLPVFIQC